MNKQLNKILEIAQKKERLILGLMSGTSLDGLDIALCSCSASGLKVLEFISVPYDERLRSRIRAIQSKETVNMEEVCRLNTELAGLYSEMVFQQLEKWKVGLNEIDLIASHGQTIYHLPEEQQTSTLQIVDGDHIAQRTGIITISDFRQKHAAAGGQGAPLAALMDEALFRHNSKNRVLLNLGGIANFTWLPSKESGAPILTSDTGPANTLINEAMQKYFGIPFDEDGKTATSGATHSELLKYLLLEPYFRKPFPKTTGQEDFNLEIVEELMKGYQIELNPNDLVATLTQLTVYSITRALDKVAGDQEYEMYVSGGGIHNPVIMAGLKERLANATIKPFQELRIHPDAKEAALMAFLANAMILGNSFEVEGEEVNLGKISLSE